LYLKFELILTVAVI